MTEIKVTLAKLKSGQLKLAVGEPYRIIVVRNQATLIEFDDALFRTNSAVLLPGAPTASKDEPSPGCHTLVAACLRFCRKHPDKRCLVTGHTDTVGSDEDNVKLSQHRSEVVYAALVGDRDLFGTAADGPHLTTKEAKAILVYDKAQVLDWVEATFGWPCGYAHNGNDIFKATEKFQRAYNDNDHAGNPDGADMKVDRDFGPSTWKAVFDCYEHALADQLGIARAELADARSQLKFLDGGPLRTACGEFHPIEKVGRDNYRSQTNRRVEVLFFDPGEEPQPPLACASGGCEQRDCTLFDKRAYRRVPLENMIDDLTLYLLDEAGQRMPNAPYRLDISPDDSRVGQSDAESKAIEKDVLGGRTCRLYWGKFDPANSDAPPNDPQYAETYYTYADDIYLSTNGQSNVYVMRKLANLGFDGEETKRRAAFAQSYGSADDPNIHTAHDTGLPRNPTV
jgi:hypothetical protein